MTESQVIASLGQPTKQHTADDGDKVFCYHDLGIAVEFEPTNEGRLGWMSIVSPHAELWGRRVLNRRRAELEPFVDQHLSESKSEDDFGSWTSLTWDDSWLELQFTLDHLSQINLGVPYGEDNAPIWPLHDANGEQAEPLKP